jgi:ribonuclease D
LFRQVNPDKSVQYLFKLLIVSSGFTSLHCGDYEWILHLMPAFYSLIATPTQLESLLSDIRQEEMVAVDTEADNMHHYREKLCLIQVGLRDRVWLVDPLNPELNIRPLLELLETRIMLMHGADFDLRLLHRHHGPFKPRAIFDTMLAAQLMGRDQIGLAALVTAFCDINLVKKWQRADWTRRPLKDEMIEYAADDVRYLPAVHQALKKELQGKTRLGWHEQACQRMIESAQASPTHEPDPWRIKGGRHFKKRAAAVLREVWHWREEIAEQTDLPPFKIANSDFLLQWPKWIEENPDAGIGTAPGCPKWMRGSRRRTFERALRHALDLETHQWPIIPKSRKKTGGGSSSQDEELLKKMIAERDKQAHSLEIDPGVLVSRESLKTLARECPLAVQHLSETSGLMPWQVDCLAQPLLKLIKDHSSNGSA